MQWSAFAISIYPSKSSQIKLTNMLPKCRNGRFVLSANSRIPLLICHFSKVVHAVKTMPYMWHHEIAATIHGNLAMDFVGFSPCQSYIATYRQELMLENSSYGSEM